jgi:glycosyltransferase involved in cell wall biosynthesis
MISSFQGKVGLIQRVLPTYRTPFFNTLSRACQDGLHIFAGQARPGEMIHAAKSLEEAHLTHGKNIHLFRGAFYLCYQKGLLSWLSETDPDILIVEANPRHLRTPAAIRWMHQRQRPVIGWGLGAPPLSGPLAVFRQKQRRKLMRQFDAILTYSQKGASEYAALGYPSQKIFTAVNAVTPRSAHALPPRPETFEKDKAKVLFVGRLQARKHVDNLIQACARLPQTLQPTLIITGDGPVLDQLKTLAQETYPSTKFTGARYGEGLADIFKAADLFVLPGTGGLAVQQAMSYGLPIIIAEADGTQDDLVRPENGWQIPSDDVDALIQTLQTALGSAARLRQMGAESYRIVSEEINLEKMASVFLEAIKKACEER